MSSVYLDMSLEELRGQERIAYAQGASVQCEMLGVIADLRERVEHLEELIAEQRHELERRADFDEYKAFFEACFELLSGNYPCPSVTSDYDKSVIFEAIERGEAASRAERARSAPIMVSQDLL